jgi:hypothetical protein
MSNTALSAAARNVNARLISLTSRDLLLWEYSSTDPKKALELCDELDVRVDKLITSIALLRQTALKETRERKGRA